MKKMKKVLSILLCLCMLSQNLPMVAFAAELDNLCEHHTAHTAECGYAETVEGQPCTHAHDEHCGYIEAVEGASCACVAAEDGILTHAEDCGYVEAVAGVPCAHAHDDACGYVAAVEAHECHYECVECENAFPSGKGGTAQAVTDEVTPVCNCGTDDAAIHATTCAVYVAPENPQCFCVEKCTEANVWCDVCGFDYSKCTGTDTAAAYADDNDLYISGVMNMSSTPYLASGSTTASATKPETGGYAHWDAASNTLTLNNFTSATGAVTGICYQGDADLCIELVGNNSVTGGNGGPANITDFKSGVWVNTLDTNVIFSGDGTLTATGTGNGYGVCARGDITVDSDATLIATGGSSGNGGESGGHGVYAYSGSITVNGGSLTGNSSDSHGVVAYNITVENGGIMEATGKDMGVNVVGTSESGGSLTVNGDSHIVANGGSSGNKIPVGNLPEDYYYYASGDGTDKTFTHSADAPLTGTVTETYFELVTAQHLSDTYTSNGDATHSRYCSCALHTKVTAPEACSGGTATCTTPANCANCGVSYGELAPNNHASTEFTYAANEDGTTHKKMHKCCNAVAAEAENHTGGTATCKDKAVCTVCGESYGELDAKNHTPGENADYTDNGNGEHSYTCTVCGTTVTEAHTYDDEDGTCACGLVKTYTITLTAGYTGVKIVEINGQAVELLPGGTFTVPHGQELTVKFVNTVSQKETGVHCDAWDEDWPPIDFNYDEATNTMTIPANEVNRDIFIDAYAYVSVQFNLHGGALTDDGRKLLVERSGYTWDAETSTLKAGYSFNFALRPEYFQLAGHTLAGAKVDGSEEVVQQLKIRSDMTVDILWECDGTAILTPVPAKDATCMEAGNIAHYVCTCGKLYEDEAGTKELTAEEVKTNIDPNNHVENGFDSATGKCACDYQFGFYVERDIEIDGIYHETYWFDNLSDALSYAHGSTDYGQYTTQSATVILHRDLTIEEGEIFSFQKQVVLDTNSFSVTNHGTLALEGYTYSTIPAAITGGTVKIGEKSYTWDSENNKWICAEGSHVTELEENKATCAKAAICDLCGASYGDLAAHTPDANGKCTVENCGYQYPAKVGDTFYETVHKALRAAEGINGCTLILLDNITLTSMSSTASYVNMGTFTLDLNGKTLSSNKGTLSVLGSANLTIKDSVGGGKIVSTGSNAINQSGGKVTIESGTFEGTLDGVFLSGGSTLIVKGGTFIGSRAMITGFGSNVKIDLTDIAPTGFTLKNNGSGTFAPNLPSGYAMVNGNGEVVNSLSAEESATVKASLENATVTLDKTTFTYDGQPHKPGVTVTLSGRKLTEGTDYRVFYSGARKMQDGKPSQWFGDYTTSADCINAGEDYYAVVIGLGNYYTKDAFTLYENFVIKPKEVTALTFVGLNEVYAHTGEAIEPTFTVKDGETEIPTSEYTVAYSNNSEVGTATITITDNKGGNYTVSGSKTFQIVVHIHVWNYSASGNTITATCSGDIGTCPDPEQSITLTVPEDHTYTGDATYSASVEGSIDGVTCSVLYTGANTGYSSSEAPVNADTYIVTLTAGGDSVSDTFTISPKNIANCTASLNEDQFAYSGKAPELGVTVVDGSVGNSTLTKDTDYTVGDVQSNAGIYKLTVTGIGNYTGTLELDYTITAKEVSIIGAEIKAVTYDPAGYTLNVIGVTFGGVVEGENLAYTPTAELTGTNAVGERDATVTVTLNNSNYTLKTATYKATVTINKAVATVTAAPTAKALTYTGEAKDLINGGSANGGEMQYSTDNETWSTTIPQGTDAGEYTVYYKVVADANHSDTEPGNIKVKIDKALLTVTAKDNTIAYGEVPSGNGVEYSGFANGETEAMLGGTVAYTYNYQRYGNVGSYKITPAGLTSGNYDITFADGILTVVAKTITVTAEGKSKTYGEADPELTYKVEGLVNGDELTGALSRETGENVDTYSIVQGNLAAGSNYAITFTGADFTISKRSVTITAKDQTIFYGTEISNTEIAANGLVDGHSVTATLTPSTTMLTENGTITASNAVIKANGADVTANYEISYEDGKLVIAFDTSVIDALEPETVKSDDQSNLEEILDTIDGLLEEEGLTEEQKKTLEDSKAKAEELLDVIESVQDDLNTENTEKVEDVTADNVRPEEKEALEDAKADLEKALKDNAGNYTEEEKQAIRNDIQRIEDAMVALENAEAVEEAIKDLPETVEPDDEDDVTDIEAAKKAYEELTTHEKSLIDKELREKLEALLDDAYDYDIIKGDGGKWTKGSSSGLSFTANGPFSKFVGIEVDDKEVDEQYYEAKSGSTIITLKKSFLKKLSTGKHTITVLYTDGETSGTFKILAASSNPATGDDSNIMLSGSVCAVSFMALAALFLKSRKHKQTK